MKEGDSIAVAIIEVGPQGKLKLSRRAVLVADGVPPPPPTPQAKEGSVDEGSRNGWYSAEGSDDENRRPNGREGGGRGGRVGRGRSGGRGGGKPLDVVS